MRLVCISDTHGQHDRLTLPEGDVLVHAGDFTERGTLPQVQQFMDWLAVQPFRHKVFIAGNHDFLAEEQPGVFRDMVPAGCHYLENEAVEIEGLTFWGSPITPWFFDWAFNRHRGEAIRPYWEAIPPQTDVLVTHGPPYGIRDLNLHGQLTGCEELNHRVWQVQPQAHVFGHIHEGHGVTEVNDIRFLNAAVLDVRYQPVHQPLVLEL